MKKLLRDREFVEKGDFQMIPSVFCQKSMFSLCLLLRLKFRIARGASRHPALWVIARLLVTRPIALPPQWIKEARCESSPLPGFSARM